MKNELKRFTNFYTGHVAIIFSLITSGYWILVNSFDVYTYTLVGAIYESLWLFMVLLLFLVPIASLIGVIVNKFKRKLLLYNINFIKYGDIYLDEFLPLKFPIVPF